MYDCVIIGGGPAGLTAATYLARFLRSTLVIDAGDGRASRIPTTHNLLGFPDGISGGDLLVRMHRHAAQYGAELVTGIVDRIDRVGTGFVVHTKAKTFSARTILLAQGVTNHRPRMAQGTHDQGVAQGLIRYCPICDAYEIRGKRVAVLGCSGHGAAEAIFVRHYSDTITLLTQDASELSQADEANLTRNAISVERSPVSDLSVNEKDLLVHLADGRLLQFDTLYVALGTSIRSELARIAGAELSPAGCIVVDEHQQTTIAGLFAAGDMIEGLDQIAVAAGQAAKAATAIHNLLSG
ncbi:NAD(P)/FAD-dependent oxidoreductase [Sphingobium sp. Cam5-1]|jgi:thioredoxin reductase (NADPH)|uniref:NAD(P)/FAD-dependent oxidoreductase n=1 Tax=Sphingobium sp. Cam5-1 TaxID=2789327 RepID=UPI0018AD22B9|nr:NAD(P)/FAD-dependent oxidoreductase [Sphingobium sp. Cam5-1]QPI75765.1 NAD(P)/FAD-dependent oxidoreductase [Sphingobium sp. Cam5-1]